MQRMPRAASARLIGGATLALALWLVAGLALVFLGLVLYVPAIARLFLFESLNLPDLGTAVALGVLSVIWFEGIKLWRNVHVRLVRDRVNPYI